MGKPALINSATTAQPAFSKYSAVQADADWRRSITSLGFGNLTACMPSTALQNGCHGKVLLPHLEFLPQFLCKFFEEYNRQGPPFNHQLCSYVYLLRQPRRIFQEKHPRINEEAAVPVLWETCKHFQASDFERQADVKCIYDGVDEPLGQFVKRHQIGARLATDLQLRVRPDVTTQDAIGLQRPNAVEALGACSPQVFQSNLTSFCM
mmetsp:Transcript_19014/g.36618  ORF Transcript_19014/g.36618 Transcript_19014/m.36618 type:complete len:207 (+) Transcript_19014:253-873(+)